MSWFDLILDSIGLQRKPKQPTQGMLQEAYQVGFVNGHAQGEIAGWNAAMTDLQGQLDAKGSKDATEEDLQAVRTKRLH